MVKTILLLAFFLLAVSGLCELIHFFTLLVTSTGKPNKTFMVIMLKKGTAFEQLRFVRLQKRWLGDKYAEKIVAICPQTDENEYNSCKMLCDMNDILLCPFEALDNVLQSLSN